VPPFKRCLLHHMYDPVISETLCLTLLTFMCCMPIQVRLGRTEQILRSRDRNLGEFLEELEAKRGVAG